MINFAGRYEEFFVAAQKVADSTNRRVALFANFDTGEICYACVPQDRASRIKRQGGYKEIIWLEPRS